MASTVRIAWSCEFDNEYRWNEVCARAIEMFGLPGDRFTTSANINYMDFTFNSNKDALMFALEHNGRIVPEDELTVELIVKYMQ
jgi:hypothetical protein